MVVPDTSRVSRDSLRISSVDQPGWEPSPGRVPDVGEYIYCLAGPAEVVRLLGRTSDGSRLLELRCEDRTQPFFASSSQVLFRTGAEDSPVFLDPADTMGNDRP